MISEQAAIEPDELLAADGFGERALDVGFASSRVSILVAQTLAGGEKCAAAVAVDSAAFEDEGMAPQGHGCQCTDGIGDLGIARKVVLAAPPIEGKGRRHERLV